MIDQDQRQRLIDNNRRISELLEENEIILRKAGYCPPVQNFALEQSEKIRFPSGYIRTVASFNDKYHLKDIFPNPEVRHNVIYALEVSDLINYVFNRINIWGPVATIFYKLAIVNIVSVIEAIVLEAANNICGQANCCEKIGVCSHHFSKEQRNYARKALVRLVEIGVLDFKPDELSRVQEVLELRNRIHIRLTCGNELKLADFNLKLYNEIIKILQLIDEQIFLKAVPIYECNI